MAAPRKVRCPNCRTALAEPPSPIFECPICSTLLLAKGARANFQGESLQSSSSRDGQGMVHMEQANDRDISSGEGCRVLGQEQLACHDEDKQDPQYGRLINEPSRVEGDDGHLVDTDCSKRQEFKSVNGTGLSKELGQDDLTDYQSEKIISTDVEVIPRSSNKGTAEDRTIDASDGVALLAEEESSREHLELPSVQEVPPSADERMVRRSGEAAALAHKERGQEELEIIAAVDVIATDGDKTFLEEKMARIGGEGVLLARDSSEEIKLEGLNANGVMDLSMDDKAGGRDGLDGGKGIYNRQLQVLESVTEDKTSSGREALVSAQLPFFHSCADGMSSIGKENDRFCMSTFGSTSVVGGSNGLEALVINQDAAIAVELPFSDVRIDEVVSPKQESEVVYVVHAEPAFGCHESVQETYPNNGLIGGDDDEIATQENRTVGLCEAADWSNYKHISTISLDGKEEDNQTLLPEIIRDVGYELSFSKGVSAAKPVDQICQQRSYTEKLPLLSPENSASDKPINEHLNVVPPSQSDESYSSKSESYGCLDSEFDFPAPSLAEGLQSLELSDRSLVNKTSKANPLAEASGIPHQLKFVVEELNGGYGEEGTIGELAGYHNKMGLNEDATEGSADIWGLSSNGHEAIANDHEDNNLNGSGLMLYTSVESLVGSTSGDGDLLKEDGKSMESDLYSVPAQSDDTTEAGVSQSKSSQTGHSLEHLYLYQNIRMAQASKRVENTATSSYVPSWKVVGDAELVGKKGLTPVEQQSLVAEQTHDGEGKLASLYTSQERRLSYNDGFSSRSSGLLGDTNYQSEVVMGRRSVNHFGHYCVSTGCSFDGHYRGSQHIDGDVVPALNRSYSKQLPSHHSMVAGGQGVSHYGYPAIPSVCTLCMHCQHPCLLHPHMPSCALCYSHSVSMAHQQGYYHPHASYQAAIPVFDVQVSAAPLKPQSRKLRHYPPLPQRGTAPYFMCKGCNYLLHVPEDLNPIYGTTQKLQCGECGRVSRLSVCNDVRRRMNGGSQTSAMDPTREALASASSSAHMNRLSLQPSFVSWTRRSMDYEGSVCMQSGAGLHTLALPSSGDLTSSDHCSHEEKVMESHARRRGFGSSSNLSFEFKAPPCGLETESFGDGGLTSRFSPFVQATVDEKDEGLDYGAPRMSDGDSLDQRSPESRMRSPENRETFPPVREDMVEEAATDSGEVHLAVSNSLRHPSFGQLEQSDPRLKRTLMALLNQESTKFEINFEERGSSFDESQSAVWSPVSDSPGMQDELGTTDNKRPVNGGMSVPHGLSSQNYLRKGPGYIVGLMRSLKDFGKRDSIKGGHEERI